MIDDEDETELTNTNASRGYEVQNQQPQEEEDQQRDQSEGNRENLILTEISDDPLSISDPISPEDVNNDLVEEVRKNILLKIDEYNQKITEEESTFIAMKDLLLQKKNEKSSLLSEINREKKDFFDKMQKEKEAFDKKQEMEIVAFWDQIKWEQIVCIHYF